MPCPPDKVRRQSWSGRKKNFHHDYRLFPYFKCSIGRSFLSETEITLVLSAKKWPTGVCEIECVVSKFNVNVCAIIIYVCKLLLKMYIMCGSFEFK